MLLVSFFIIVVEKVRALKCVAYFVGKPWVDFFTYETMIHPVTNRPADKRSFIPSHFERIKVCWLFHGLYGCCWFHAGWWSSGLGHVNIELGHEMSLDLSTGWKTRPRDEDGLDQAQAGKERGRRWAQVFWHVAERWPGKSVPIIYE